MRPTEALAAALTDTAAPACVDVTAAADILCQLRGLGWRLARTEDVGPEPLTMVDEDGRVCRMKSAHPLHNHSCRFGPCDLYRATPIDGDM